MSSCMTSRTVGRGNLSDELSSFASHRWRCSLILLVSEGAPVGHGVEGATSHHIAFEGR